jgi:acylphosphatase
MEERVVLLRIAGLVQGVGFRAFVEGEARRLGVRGWVRNRRDRTVEAVIAGPPDLVGEMLVACRRGPPGSQVEDVEVEAAGAGIADTAAPGPAFRVQPTA